MNKIKEVHIPSGTDFNNVGNIFPTNKKSKKKNIIKQLLDAEKELNERSKGDIIFSPPIVSRFDTGIIRQGTINIIQGKFGVHKSRYAEMICSLLLQSDANKKMLGFQRYPLKTYTVCLVDTERNLQEELPNAIQNIKIKAGHSKTDDVKNFRFTSLKQLDRKDRLPALKTYIQSVRKSTTNHLFILLDVVTDCVSSFNRDDESMKLFDFFGNLCDDENVTVLLLIHENFGTEKARGHTGTEATNKASCVMQIGFEKDSNNKPTDLIKLRFIKLRGARKPEPIYLRYSQEAKGLVLAEKDFIQTILRDKQQKASVDDIKMSLYQEVLGKEVNQKELVELLRIEYDCSLNTIKKRLNDFCKIKIPITDPLSEKEYILTANITAGKPTTYKLIESTQ